MKLHRKHAFWLLALLCIFQASVVSAEDFVALDGGPLLKGEILVGPSGLMIRDRTTTIALEQELVVTAFPEKHYNFIIKHDLPWNGLRGVFSFGAGEDYLWDPGHRSPFWRRDATWRVLKIAGLLVTGVFYWQAQRANARLGNSINGINDSGARGQFLRYRNYYYGSAAVTGVVWLGAALVADDSYGSNWDGRDLNILREAPLSPTELQTRPSGKPDVSVGITFDLGQ